MSNNHLVSFGLKRLCVLLSLLYIFVLSACVSNKKVAYFQNVPDSTKNIFTAKEFPYSEPLIQPDDILSISIQTIDPQTSTVINQITPPIPAIGNSSAAATGNQVITGFLVDKDGFIELPMIGTVKLGGLSTFKARDLIGDLASKYFKNPTVIVRFANYKITVLGEVARPGTYTLPNEKVTILDAIGLAGDLTVYGIRNNVMLIRENGTSKQFVRFDLNSTEIFNSPYFFLKQNDIIYIEPSKAKIASLNVARAQLITIISAALTLLIVVVTRVP